MFTQRLRPRFRVRRVAANQRPLDIEQHRLELETHVTTRPLPARVHVAMLCTVVPHGVNCRLVFDAWLILLASAAHRFTDALCWPT